MRGLLPAGAVPTFQKTVFKPKQTNYCLCIPVINEGQNFLNELEQLKPYHKLVDVLVCDGGSTDGSVNPLKLKQLGVRSLLIKTGPGKLSAQLRMGYHYALTENYRGIITIDGNGKDSLESIPQFVETLQSGYDLVQGSRFIKGGQAINTPISRWLAIRLIHAPWISWLSGFPYTDTTNGYRGYSAKLLKSPRLSWLRPVFSGYELLMYLSVKAPRLGFKVKEIPVTRSYPQGKIPTKITAFKGQIDLLRILIRLTLGAYESK